MSSICEVIMNARFQSSNKSSCNGSVYRPICEAIQSEPIVMVKATGQWQREFDNHHAAIFGLNVPACYYDVFLHIVLMLCMRP